MRLLDFGLSQRIGGTALSLAGKSKQSKGPPLADQSRRDFLMRCCQGTAAAFLSGNPGRLVLSSPFAFPNTLSDAGYHLHPRYRGKLPLEAVLRKVDPAFDRFVTEKYAAEIDAILAKWSADLLRSTQDLAAIAASLSGNFQGASLKSSGSKPLRSESWLKVQHSRFSDQVSVRKDNFVSELKDSLSGFSKIETAEFQITDIQELSNTADTASPSGPTALRTRVRYELVGTGHDFHREQWMGEWDLGWRSPSKVGDAFLVSRWLTLNETRARSMSPIFVDISSEAFAGAASYKAQLLHGADYWRTVLDGASGIDIYGHNGVAVGDIDGDGFDDLYVCQPAGLPNRLYRNRGDGTFEDVTEPSGLGILENTACALFADFINDGRQDLVVVRSDGPVLFLNEGNGKFRRHPDAFRFAKPPQGTFTGAAVADYDRDGWLDIYFCLYLYYQGTDQYKYPLPYFDANNGPPNFLMRNQRDGTFLDVTEKSGLNQNNTRYSFCCAWNDYDRDGWPDLYVVNDFGRKNLYHNNGDGTFTDVADRAGVEDVGAGMSLSWLDYDNDGADDLYVANMWTAAGQRISAQEDFQKGAPDTVRSLYRKHSMGNSLFRGTRAAAGFQNAANAGVEMGRWSWSSDAWDFDHDGYPDLYITNGMVSGPAQADLNSFFWRQVVANSPAQPTPVQEYEQGWNALNDLIRSDGTWSGYERNVFYLNNRDGTFSDVSGVAGLDFVEDGRSFALADFDHDGRLEVLLKNRNGPQVRVLKNVIQDLAPSIAFHLRGVKSNRDAIGAVVTITTSAGQQTRTLQAGSGFLAQHTKDVFFGLGAAKGPVRASVRWPSGLVQELHDLPSHHRILVEEGKEPRPEPFQPPGQQNDLTATAPVDSLPAVVDTWLLAPLTAPDFTLPDLAGRPVTLSDLRGRRVLVHFWMSGVPDCIKDIETFNRHYATWRGQGLHVLSVNTDETFDPMSLRSLLDNDVFGFAILHATDDIAGTYNVLYRYLFDRHRDLPLPASFLLDDRGEIVKIYQGAITAERIQQDFAHIPRTPAERLGKALPFPGLIDSLEFQRNYLALGSVFFQREYFDSAKVFFNLALREDPVSAEALYGLGSVYLKQNKKEEAHDCFERATKARAGFPETLPNAWNNLGLLATQEGRTVDAIPLFQQALNINPNHLIALDNLANAYRQQKQWGEARKILEHALAVSPQNPEANYSLAMVYAQTNDEKRAYEYLQKALQERPDYPEALNNLGILYLRTGRRDDAVKSFEECIRVAPTFDQSYLNLARVHALEGEPEKARAVLQSLLKQNPDNAAAKKAITELGQ